MNSRQQMIHKGHHKHYYGQVSRKTTKKFSLNDIAGSKNDLVIKSQGNFFLLFFPSVTIFLWNFCLVFLFLKMQWYTHTGLHGNMANFGEYSNMCVKLCPTISFWNLLPLIFIKWNQMQCQYISSVSAINLFSPIHLSTKRSK